VPCENAKRCPDSAHSRDIIDCEAFGNPLSPPVFAPESVFREKWGFEGESECCVVVWSCISGDLASGAAEAAYEPNP